MKDLRDHQPVRIEEFNGLWARGDKESCPLDHETDCNNVISFEGGFRTRPGITLHQIGDDPNSTIPNLIRVYKYVYRNTGDGLLLLDALGNIYHSKSPTPLTPILTIATMTDFSYVSMGGRAYITPHDGSTGLENEFLYVYLGDGTPARKAAGAGPTTAPTVANGASTGTQATEAGIHIIAVAYETNTGFITKSSPKVELSAPGGDEVDITNIPVSPDSFVVKRHILSSKAIDPVDYTQNIDGYELFFVPNGTIENNTATALTLNWFDAELLESADYLNDLFEEIPAFVNLTTYHNRLVGVGEFGDPSSEETYGLISTARLSAPGQPEAIDQISGLIVVPLNGEALSNCQEYRDVLYLFKVTQTHAYNDNGDDPSSWPGVVIDQGVGASIHGIAYVLDSGGVNIEYLLVIDYSGVMMFDGAYRRPELSWKIKDFWFELDRDDFKNMQFMNDSLTQWIYINLPNRTLLVGDYTTHLDPEKIKWWKWTFDIQVTTIALIEKNKLIIGSRAELEP